MVFLISWSHVHRELHTLCTDVTPLPTFSQKNQGVQPGVLERLKENECCRRGHSSSSSFSNTGAGRSADWRGITDVLGLQKVSHSAFCVCHWLVLDLPIKYFHSHLRGDKDKPASRTQT